METPLLDDDRGDFDSESTSISSSSRHDYGIGNEEQSRKHIRVALSRLPKIRQGQVERFWMSCFLQSSLSPRERLDVFGRLPHTYAALTQQFPPAVLKSFDWSGKSAVVAISADSLSQEFVDNAYPGTGFLRHFHNKTGSRPERAICKPTRDKIHKTLRVVSWNIERGHHIDEIVEELRTLQPDILILSEVDVYTGRCTTTRCNAKCAAADIERRQLDCGEKIARALGFYCLQAVEMKLVQGGIMCNAILSRYPIVESYALPHDHQLFTYTADTTRAGQNAGYWQRSGLRTAAAAVICAPCGRILV